MILAVDFDGTICKNKFPSIGEANEAILQKLINMRKDGHQIILWTCREGTYLNQAIIWCREKGLEFDAINESLERLEDFGKRKVYADLYIDDRSLHPKDFENL